MLGQVLGRSEQHGGVAIMATGVHTARMAAGVGKGIELLHRQRIHIGAQANSARRCTRLDDADHAGRTHAPVHGDTPGAELGGDHIGGALFLETQLGVGVQIAPHSGYSGGVFHNRVD